MAPDSSFLLVQSLDTNYASWNNWVPANHVADLGWVGQILAVLAIWGATQQVGTLALFLPMIFLYLTDDKSVLV